MELLTVPNVSDWDSDSVWDSVETDNFWTTTVNRGVKRRKNISPGKALSINKKFKNYDDTVEDLIEDLIESFKKLKISN
jgi:hypothetical protein